MKKTLFIFMSFVLAFTLVACQTTSSDTTVSKDSFTVNFVLFDDTSLDALTVEDGELLSVPTTPTREGYSFMGWYTDNSFTTSWNFNSDTVTSNMTLYAKWSQDITTFTVTFNTNGGSAINSIVVNENATCPEPAYPTKDGYTFAGWYLEATFETEWFFYTSTVTSDMTLYAKWDLVPIAYTVTFSTDGGTAVVSQPVEENETANRPGNPAKEGFVFAGWYSDAAFTTLWDFGNDQVTADTTLYAKWKAENNYMNSFKVLSIGNSFSEDAQRYLYAIALSYGIPAENIVIANMYIGGCSLATHVANMATDAAAYQYQLYTSTTLQVTNNVKLSDALAYEDWDVITLQQVSNDSGVPSSYSNYVSRLVTYIEENATNPNVALYWHMTWAYQQTSTHSGFLNYQSDQSIMYQAITSTVATEVLTISQFEGVIPSGTAIQNARTSYMGDNFNRDGYHLSDPLGRYIAGLMFFKEITGFDVSPTTIAYMPSGVSQIQQELAMEAVNNAYAHMYNVTNSTYTTEPEPEPIDVNGVEFSFEYVQGFWNDNATAVAPSTDALYNSFAAVMPIPKYLLPVGSEIVMAEGYQYRVIFFEKVGEDYHVVYRTALYQVPYIEIDEAFWGNYDYVGFNITTNPTSVINDRLDEVVGKFHLYHPEGTGEGHVDGDLTWSSGLWEVGGHALVTTSPNYLSSNPLTPAFYDYDTVFEVASGYKMAYVVLSYDMGQYTVDSVSSFQTEYLYVDQTFADGKELLAFILTTTNEDTDLTSTAVDTILSMHPMAVPHTDSAISFTTGYWELGKHAITTGDTSFIKGYGASSPQSKEYYAGIDSITVEAGYQVRVIYLGYDGYGEYTVLFRTANLTGTILLDETFWGEYEYVAFNISKVVSEDLSGVLASLPGKLTYATEGVNFSLGYWNTNGVALTASTVYAGSNIITRQVLPAGTLVTIEAGYQVRVIFFTYSAETGYKVAARSENFVGSFVLTDGLYLDYQWIGFNISTAPSTSDLTASVDTLGTKLTFTPFTAELVDHSDMPLSFTSGYWNNYAQSITTGDTAFIKGFAASNVLSKSTVGVYDTLTVAEGYQVRVIYLDYSYNTYSVLYRSANLTGVINLDEAFWGDYQYVAFNISKVVSEDLSGVLETLPPLLVFAQNTVE
ncbi:MAG: DUF4886 domain-containing protein [Candidatus Izemoplasmatales bacterium]